MKKMWVYISGPISGIENDNAAAFSEAQKFIIEMGGNPVNPLSLYKILKRDMGKEPNYFELLDYDIKTLYKCNMIMFIDGWEGSLGAQIEYVIAKKFNIPMYDRNLKPFSEDHTLTI